MPINILVIHTWRRQSQKQIQGGTRRNSKHSQETPLIARRARNFDKAVTRCNPPLRCW